MKKNMYIKWPAYMDGAGISTELEEIDPIKKLADLPRRVGRKGLIIAGYDIEHWRHSFWKTDECVKAKAIIHSSVASSIQKVREKLAPLVPAHEGLENFLSTWYSREREDGLIVDKDGRISEKPKIYWRYSNLSYNSEGFIKGTKKKSPHHRLTKDEVVFLEGIKTAKRKANEEFQKEKQRYADFYLRFINLPKDLQETRTNDSYPLFTYWRLLCYVYNIDLIEQSHSTSYYSRRKWYDTIRIKETVLTKYRPETILEMMKGIEDEYFALTGKRYREGIRVK